MKENKEFENLKSLSEKILEEKDSILEKSEKEHPETKRLKDLVDAEIEQTRNGWEKDGKKEYEAAIEKEKRINYYKEHPEALDGEIWHIYREALNFLPDKDREAKLLELKEKKVAELSNGTPENYLKNRKERLDGLKKELDGLPSMDLEIFKDEIYNKSPEKINEMTDGKGRPIAGSYLNQWHNAVFDGQKLLSWKQLPLESSKKLFFYKGYADQLKGYKEYNGRFIEMIEAGLNGFLKAAIENKDIESVVDSAILLKKLDSPEITSFVKEQIEELHKSPEKADKEKLISVSEKISQIEK